MFGSEGQKKKVVMLWYFLALLVGISCPLIFFESLCKLSRRGWYI